MNLQMCTIDKIKILRISGRFDAQLSPYVDVWLRKETAVSSQLLLANLSDVSFIDYTGLGTLTRGLKRCQQQQGRLNLCGLQNPVRVVFELLGQDKIFNIFDNEEMARMVLTPSAKENSDSQDSTQFAINFVRNSSYRNQHK